MVRTGEQAEANHKRLCGFFTVFGTGFDPIDKGIVLILKCVRNNGRPWTLAIPRAVIARGGRSWRHSARSAGCGCPQT